MHVLGLSESSLRTKVFHRFSVSLKHSSPFGREKIGVGAPAPPASVDLGTLNRYVTGTNFLPSKFGRYFKRVVNRSNKRGLPFEPFNFFI